MMHDREPNSTILRDRRRRVRVLALDSPLAFVAAMASSQKRELQRNPSVICC
jgi:hypothetical protein